MNAIGIDMSKNTFHAALDDREVRIFENSESGIESFFSFLTARHLAHDATTIGVEATGAYHLLLCVQARQSGWRIVVINPLETYHVTVAASLRKVKTDRKDALMIRTWSPSDTAIHLLTPMIRSP
jgi:transposase